ncbi:hypothetical protein pb186bvf_013975 [Paramecium bursaria]
MSDELIDLNEFTYKKQDGQRSKQNQIKQSHHQQQREFIPAQKEKIKKQKHTQSTAIQDMNFKYVWNFLKQNQDSDRITILDLIVASKAVLKQPLTEEQIIDMLNINNPQLYADSEELEHYMTKDDLYEIFKECKL